MTDSNDLMKEGIVSFFFLGRAPAAPGTFGSLGALGIAYLVSTYISDFTGVTLLIMAGAFYYLGLQLAPWCEDKFGNDPGVFVLDEVIGYLIPIGFLLIMGVELDAFRWALSFIAFRGFDVVKLWPAKDLESMTSGHGIILDDVAAGFQTLILMLLIEQSGILL